MRTTLFTTALVAVANAGNVHDFMAESHFICQMCQTAMTHVAKNEGSDIDNLYELFPALEQRISAFNGRSDLIDLANVETTCRNIGLCET